MAGSMTEDGNRATFVLDGRQAAAVIVRGTPGGSGPAAPTAMVKQWSGDESQPAVGQRTS